MRPRRTPNPKRQLQPKSNELESTSRLATLADAVTYGGNPEHKRDPGDFGLKPPSLPRQGKSLCDNAAIFLRSDAVNLLREGLRRGLVSCQQRNGWPQNIWAVTGHGLALEAMLENAAVGTYHGYPMLPEDPLAEEVIERWGQP